MGAGEQDFAGSTSSVESDSAIAGAYAGYRRGGYYSDAIVKYEHQRNSFKGAATDELTTPFVVDLFGLSLETGYRLGRQFYAQPRAAVTYVHAAAGSFQDESGMTVELADGESLTGEAGTRFGAMLPSADLYLDAGLRHEFMGEMEAEVGGFTFTDQLPGTVALLAAGVTAKTAADKVHVTLSTGYARGKEAEEFTASGSFWFKF
jgi:outer membrane autotransporter protein